MSSHVRRLPAAGAVAAVAALLLVVAIWLPEPTPVYAQCGLPGTPPCPPPKKPTKTPTRRPRTPTPTETATPTPTEAVTPTATPVPCDSGVLTAKLTGGDEVPSVITEGQGNVKLLLDTTAGAVTGNWQIADLSGFITAAHIHNGPAGKNAGVFIGFTGLPPVGGSFATANGAPTAKLLDVLANPPGFYVNVHTNAHPGGEIRGQLACAPAGEPVSSPTPTPTATSASGPAAGGRGESGLTGISMALLGLGGLSMGLGMYSLRRSPFTGGVQVGLIAFGALSVLGAILLLLMIRATPPPGHQGPAASPTFDYRQIQALIPLFGRHLKRRRRRVWRHHVSPAKRSQKTGDGWE